jgi:hypothetical protein
MDSHPTPKIGLYIQKPKPNIVLNKHKPSDILCLNKEPYQLTAFSIVFIYATNSNLAFAIII